MSQAIARSGEFLNESDIPVRWILVGPFRRRSDKTLPTGAHQSEAGIGQKGILDRVALQTVALERWEMRERLVNHTVAVANGKSDGVVVESAKQVDAEGLEFALLVDAASQHGEDFYPTLRRSGSLLPDAFVVLPFDDQCSIIA